MTGADVRSIAALREWYTALQIYRDDAVDALAGIAQEVRRQLDWVSEQGQLWSRAVRACEEAVVQAKAELAARRFPDHDGKMPDTTLQERNLRRAVAKLEHAEERVAACRRWVMRLPREVDEAYISKGHRLQVFLDTNLERSLAELARQIEALERYAALVAGSAAPPPTGERS